jgi:hypothetical protein
MEKTERLTIHHRSGEIVDQWLGRHISAAVGLDYIPQPRSIDGNGTVIDRSTGKTAYCHVKTTNSLPGHVLFEHTGRGGETGWLFGKASVLTQVINPSEALSVRLAVARDYVLDRFGEPGDVEPLPPPQCKVPCEWVSRTTGYGDKFIFVPASDLVRDCGATRTSVPLLAEVVQLCKTARNNHLSDEWRRKAMDRLESLVS